MDAELARALATLEAEKEAALKGLDAQVGVGVCVGGGGGEPRAGGAGEPREEEEWKMDQVVERLLQQQRLAAGCAFPSLVPSLCLCLVALPSCARRLRSCLPTSWAACCPRVCACKLLHRRMLCFGAGTTLQRPAWAARQAAAAISCCC